MSVSDLHAFFDKNEIKAYRYAMKEGDEELLSYLCYRVHQKKAFSNIECPICKLRRERRRQEDRDMMNIAQEMFKNFNSGLVKLVDGMKGRQLNDDAKLLIGDSK